VKKLEFGHAFSLYDPYAGYLIARLAFEARYSGAGQYFFRIVITVTGSGIWGSSLAARRRQRFEIPRP
jgi:hypothetical protein